MYSHGPSTEPCGTPKGPYVCLSTTIRLPTLSPHNDSVLSTWTLLCHLTGTSTLSEVNDILASFHAFTKFWLRSSVWLSAIYPVNKMTRLSLFVTSAMYYHNELFSMIYRILHICAFASNPEDPSTRWEPRETTNEVWCLYSFELTYNLRRHELL